MPLEGWNGRFVGVGGGGCAGVSPNAMGGPEKTRDFARLFLAPGATHCSGGAGPTNSASSFVCRSMKKK
jgi:hypothetical protein